MLDSIGTTEIIIIALVLMMLFGAKKLPEFAKGLGQAGAEFKKVFKDDDKPEKKSKSE